MSFTVLQGTMLELHTKANSTLEISRSLETFLFLSENPCLCHPVFRTQETGRNPSVPKSILIVVLFLWSITLHNNKRGHLPLWAGH